MEAHRGMWLLVSGCQVRLKRMPGKARELSIFTEGSGETQELYGAGVGMLAGVPWGQWGGNSFSPIPYRPNLSLLFSRETEHSEQWGRLTQNRYWSHNGICSDSKPSKRDWFWLRWSKWISLIHPSIHLFIHFLPCSKNDLRQHFFSILGKGKK